MKELLIVFYIVVVLGLGGVAGLIFQLWRLRFGFADQGPGSAWPRGED